MRTVGLGFVALFVLLTGCSTFGGQPSTPTVTPAEVPTAPTDGPDRAQRLAPGITAENVTDVDRLVDRHVAVIGNTSYAWTESQREYRADADGGERRIAVAATTTVRRNDTSFLRRTNYTGASPSRAGAYAYRLEEYGSDGDGYTMWLSSREGEAEYSRAEQPILAPEHNLSVAESIRAYLDLGATEITRVEGASHEYVRVNGTIDDHPSYGPVEAGRVKALVRTDGLVRRLSANVTVVVDDRRIPVEYRFAYAELGTTDVEPPAWLDEARERLGTPTEHAPTERRKSGPPATGEDSAG